MTLPDGKHRISPDIAHLARPIDSLTPLPGNPRRGDVDAVAASYNTFGQVKPVVVLPNGTVVAGNHSVAAARKLGWTHIAAVEFAGSEVEAKAFALADNRTQDLGTYDDEALIALLTEVLAGDSDLADATGYTLDDLADLNFLHGDPPTLDDLAEKHGENTTGESTAAADAANGNNESSGTPLTFIVSNDTARRFSTWWAQQPGLTDDDRMKAWLDRAEA